MKKINRLDRMYDEIFSDSYIKEIEFIQINDTAEATNKVMQFHFDSVIINYNDADDQTLYLEYDDESAFQEDNAKLLELLSESITNNYTCVIRINLFYALAPKLLKKAYIIIPHDVHIETEEIQFDYCEIDEYAEDN